ncbi:MAG: M48 family metallopeptidase [Deltaproteobacteria bacterium]|nr:M48 family metallopeptidase [Deltaproteobacteria bacterium]
MRRIHEQCHLKIKSHSPEIWKLISKTLPD